MDFDINWDIEKYKSPFESDEHWELRKNFLVAHKNKYPEDKLICLAQVFFNIEQLGCKYPDETMKIIEDLSEGIADDFREKKQQKIQRTFVKASDAAEAKIKGLPSKNHEEQMCLNKLSYPKIDLELSNSLTVNFVYNNVADKPTDVISINIIDLSKPPGSCIIQNFVIWKSTNFSESAFSIVQRSAAKGKLSMKCLVTKIETHWKCDVIIQDLIFASATATSNQRARSVAFENLLLRLEDKCYIIQEKVKIFSDGKIVNKIADCGVDVPKLNDSSSSVGSRMMKFMGWKGGGLGKTEQGTAEPVVAQNRVHRTGLGIHLSSPQMMTKMRNQLQTYANDDTQYDLVFSNEYSKEERANLHQLAKRFNLKTHSYGTGQSRYLVVSKPLGPSKSILESLLICGGENDRFKLIPPM